MCGRCKEYDFEKHYCPKFCETIKNSFEDYREANKGEWVYDEEKKEYHCSKCGAEAPRNKCRVERLTEFCPRCGSKMEENE